MFANMYLAYETLSAPMKTVLEGVKTWNVGDRKKLSQGDNMGSTREGRYVGNEKMAAKVRDPGDLRDGVRPSARAHAPRNRPQGALYRQPHANAARLQGTPRRNRSSTS